MMHGSFLKGRSLAVRTEATWSYLRTLARFVYRHIDFKLRRYGVYTAAYDKRSHRFDRIEDIGEAIAIVARVTKGEASR